MPKPRKNHYLPEFYSRQWARHGGEMVRFARKPSGEMERRRVTPGGIGFQLDLYTIPEQTEGNDQALEDGLFRLVDDFGGKALKRLLGYEIPVESEDRSKWVVFLLSLLFRAPQDLDASTKAFRHLVRTTFPNEPDSEVGARQLALRKLWTSINNPFLGGVLVKMQWDVLDFTDCGVSLLTSGCPLITSNGLKPPEGNYALPLSPTHLFVASWPGPRRTAALAAPRRKLAKLANKNIVERARRFVIASDDSQQLFIERHFASKQVPTPVELLVEAYESGGGNPGSAIQP